MNYLLPCVFVLFSITSFCIKNIHQVNDNQHPILAKVAKANFVKSVTEESQKEQSAIMTFWHVKL